MLTLGLELDDTRVSDYKKKQTLKMTKNSNFFYSGGVRKFIGSKVNLWNKKVLVFNKELKSAGITKEIDL